MRAWLTCRRSHDNSLSEPSLVALWLFASNEIDPPQARSALQIWCKFRANEHHVEAEGSVYAVNDGIMRRFDTDYGETIMDEHPVDIETTIGAARYRWHRQTRGASDTSFAWKS